MMRNEYAVKKNIEDILPLTPMQESMLVQYIKDPNNSQYFEQLVMNLEGNIEIDSFVKAWRHVTITNEMLRTIFKWDKLEQPVQIILKEYEIPIRTFDLSEHQEELRENALQKIIENDLKEGINLRKAPIRITLCRFCDNKVTMIISNHHILYDGWSNGILLNEFLDAYNRLKRGNEPVNIVKCKYKEFIKWLKTQNKNSQKSFWQNYLRDFNTTTMLPVYKRKQSTSFTAAEYEIALPKELENRISTFSKKNNITNAVVFYAAWAIFLQKYNDSEDVVFGTTISGRTHKVNGIQNMVGLFINTLPLRVNSFSSNDVFSLYKNISNSIQEREDYDSTFLTDIKQYSEINNNDTLFDSIIVVENYPIEKMFDSGDSELKLNSYSSNEQTNFDLTIAIMPQAGLKIKFIYNTDLFKLENVHSIAKHFEKLLNEIIEKPNICIKDIDILTDDEKCKIIDGINNTKTDFGKETTLQQFLEIEAEKNPTSAAVKFDGIEMTYEELNRKANRLARFLREKGVKSNTVVGLMIDRSFEMIVDIFGILKAGGTYLPIDAEFPADRIMDMIIDSKAMLLLTRENVINKTFETKIQLQKNCLEEIVFLEKIEQKIDQYADTNLECINCSKDAAYIMYTSGSSGKPKGILTTHYNISRVVKNTNYIDIKASDTLLQLSNYVFDGATFDIFGALLNGAKLVLTKKEVFLDIALLAKLIRDENVSVFFITTALFNTLIDFDPLCLVNVRKVLFGGERVSLQHVKKALQVAGKDKLMHVYGPTETTVFATYYNINEIDDELGTVPIGLPIANTKVYVLDKSKKLLPLGFPGELYISGDGVAKGYLDRSELEKERFIKNPFCEDEVFYKTGDLVRMLPDGNIEFLDRIDGQVKLRGFRIELGEIEARLLMNENIQKAIVVARNDEYGNKYLCVYIVGDGKLNINDIKDFLSETLPYYMIPAQFIFVEKLPVSTTGKIDLKALAKYAEAEKLDTVFETPTNETEEKLLGIWKEVLGKEKISINDSFFDIGGHSLKATALAAKIHKNMNVSIPLSEILKGATIKQLAKIVQQVEKEVFLPITKAEKREYYPVSSAQKGIFLQQHSTGIDTTYNIPIVVEMKGQVDSGRLENALKALVQRHEALRTSFSMINGEIVQKINTEIEFSIRCCEAEEAELDNLIKEFIKTFDLTCAPLFMAKLINVSAEKHLLVINMHHIIADGVSIITLIDELTLLYEGKQLEELEIQYKDYSVWQEQFLKGELIDRQKNFWMNKFSKDIPLLNMPLDKRRQERRSYKGSSIKFSISKAVTMNLEKFSKERSITVNNLLLSVYFILLNKYTGQEDIVVGSIVAGRRHPDLSKIVGMFNNFLPLRMNIDTNSAFEKYLDTVNSKLIEYYENQEYPFDKLVENISSRLDRSRNPLFDTMLVFHSQLEGFSETKMGNVTLKNYGYEHKTSKLDFKLDVYFDSETEQLDCVVEYNVDLFMQSTMERFAEHFQNIINEVLCNPKKQINEINILSEKEKNQLLYSFNNTKAEYPRNTAIFRLFEEQAQRSPNRQAVIFEGTALTYTELNVKANQLARLLREKGVTRNSIVALMLDRSLEMSIAIMAVLKAGGAYLPISPEFPEERIKYMLEDSGANILLTQQIIFEEAELNDLKNIHAIYVENKNIYAGDSSNLQFINDPNDLAYIIYTSGSTGKPKGVMIEHYSLVNRLNWMQKMYPIGEEDTILQKTPYTFDVSVWEQLWWSVQGASVAFLKPGGEKDPEEIVEAIDKNKITTMHFVPSMLSIFLTYIETGVDLSRLKSLRQVFASGEALNIEQVNKFNKLLFEGIGAKLYNLYGPTEATIDVSYFNCSDAEKFEIVPIGKPIDNIQLYILDSNNQLLPIGVPGELHIAGDGLARGYLNKPELTKEKFVENPFSSAVKLKMYKTGDLARWLPDGNIEYLGRIDNQVKIRGFRIELSEIEAELLKHKNVQEAVVIAKDDKEGNKYLCAYVVLAAEVMVSEFRKLLSVNLPEYMLPSYFVRLEWIPLTANGKVDRKSLPEPDMAINTGREYEAPVSETEKKLAEIWKEILGVNKIGLNDDFFELGGHSLKSAKLAMTLHKEFDVSVSIGEIFGMTTIKSMAEFIDKANKNRFISIKKVEKSEHYAVSSSQRRLFIVNSLEGANTAYNLTSMVKLEGQLDIKRLRTVFDKMISRHESLRTGFKLVGDEPVQIVYDELNYELEYIETEESGLEEITRAFIKPFDLQKPPLIRISLIKTGELSHLLMLDMHHIIADGLSSVILVDEFIKLYADEELPELKLQYKDFAAWQNELFAGELIKNQRQYWLEVFKGSIPVLDLPADFPRPAFQSTEGNKLSFNLNENIINGIKRVAGQNGATLYMVLLAAYYTLLYRYTGQEDIVVGTAAAGRQHNDLDNMIGMFVNTLAMRNYPNGNKTFSEFLEEVKKNSLKAYEAQDYQFEKLVEELQVERDVSRNPLFDTMFVLQNMGIPQMEIEGLKFLPYKFESHVSKFDLTFEVIEKESDAVLNVEYCTKLFKKATIERMAGHFINIINQIIKDEQFKLNEIEIMSKNEVSEKLYAFNQTKAKYPKNKTIINLFEQQVLKTPDNTAVLFGEKELTYTELNRKVNQLARVLREKGVGRDSIVGIMLERSLEMSIGIIAILKAGGAYLPISPDFPEERIKYMLEDSGANVLLIQRNMRNNAVSAANLNNIIEINLEDMSLFQGDDTNLQLINESNDLAYIIYTSGSTGKPKGVMIEHYSVVNRINWMQKKYPIGEKDTILQKTPFTFDVSVWELFWWSITGASVCFLKPGGEKDPSEIAAAIHNYKITTMHFVPSMLTAFLEYIEGKNESSILCSLRQVFASGEALNLQQVSKFNLLLNAENGTKLINLYGPTEATVDVSYFDCSTGDKLELIPIGKPIDNISLYVLNNNHKLQPAGVPGELYISGDGLARGYLNREELTAEKFIANPYYNSADENSSASSRMYKTGDLVRWLPDGNVEYLGRLDNQVKVRGFRIELGEIEEELLKHEAIKEAVVTARDNPAGSKYLCAYIVSSRSISVVELRAHLDVKLPEYMIPSFFVELEKMPLTHSGKIDRKALPDPSGEINTGREYIAPTNEIEASLVEIWKELLGIEKIGINDKFFELGGYSILLIKMHARLEELYPNRISIPDLFTYPTIAKLAERISSIEIENKKTLLQEKLQLPEEYFVITDKGNKESGFKLSVKQDIERKVLAAASEVKADKINVYIAAFAYLLSQIINKTQMALYTDVDIKDSIYSLYIELDKISTFTELIEEINSKRKNINETDIFNTKEIDIEADKTENFVIPVIYNEYMISSEFALLEVFDIAFEINEAATGTSIVCRFNGERLNKDKMKEFAALYVKCLEVLLG